MLGEQRDGDELAEQPLVGGLEQIPGRLELERLRRRRTRCRSSAPCRARRDELVARDQRRRPPCSRAPSRSALAIEPFGLDHVEGREPGRHGEIVLGEGRAVHHRRGPCGRKSCRKSACASAPRRPARGRRTAPWPAAPCRARRPNARPRGSGRCGPCPVWISSATNSVPYLRQSSAAPAQIVVVGNVDALALDRLDDEGGDLARRQRLLERGEIVERHLRAARQQAARSRRGTWCRRSATARRRSARERRGRNRRCRDGRWRGGRI